MSHNKYHAFLCFIKKFNFKRIQVMKIVIARINKTFRFNLIYLCAACVLGFSAAVVQAEDAPATDNSAADIDPGQIYAVACALCHKAGLNGAPKYRDKFAWKKRIAKGRETLYKNSIEGIGAMPPKGGRTTLTDEQVKATVDYMVQGSGGWGDS